MSRRGENIYKRRDGRWEGRYKKGRNDQGNIIYGYVYGKKYNDVKLALVNKQARYPFLENTLDIYSGTLQEWMTYWLDVLLKEQIKLSTYSIYKKRMTKYIFPYFKNKKMKDIKRSDISYFLALLMQTNLSSNTIKSIMSILNNSLNRAVSDNHLLNNPAVHCSIPNFTKKTIKSMSREEQAQLEKLLIQKKECCAEIIALYTGMRIGEISGLMWQDIDFTNNIIHIKRTISRIPIESTSSKTMIYIGKPKTKSSERNIPLSKNLKNYLLSKRTSQIEDYVISCRKSFTEPRIITHHFKKHLKEAQIDEINFHSLRHTFATRCVEKGVDISSLSKILGHTSTRMTLDVYTDSSWENQEMAMGKMDEQLKL
ncbi:integrase [Enterococcus rotai]|uniref:Integrase n=1 Tax=Enterococcus rotai TaxID=118060 RepID=A0A0U2X6J0_9ENTE|nr:site-specific integrase [Enterococcus rotai]ALS36455.1 hypothetical protein ATZ35_04540 [Enterococcus rotai]